MTAPKQSKATTARSAVAKDKTEHVAQAIMANARAEVSELDGLRAAGRKTRSRKPEVVYVEGVGTTLPVEPKTRARRHPVVPEAEIDAALIEVGKILTKTVGAVKVPKAPRPNAERRNEATHVDGAAAVAHGKCTKCGAKKGARCVSKLGKETNFVHSPRMAAWDQS